MTAAARPVETAPTSLQLRLDSGVSLPNEGALQQAVEIFLPTKAPSVVFVCLPGGGMNRRFFDLVPPEGDSSFSFARQMVARGFAVVTIDHLGIGESTRPEDGHALTAELLAQANANVVQQVLDGLRTGSIGGRALPKLRSIGVGHSMGALLTVLQQDARHQHDAIVLLGFGTRGLPEYLSPEAKALASDTVAVRARIGEFAKKMFPVPYPRITRSPRGNDLYGSGNVDGRGVDALKSAIEPILPVPAYMSMLPGNVAPEAARVDVPLFIGIGERDMVGPPEEVPKSFPGSPDVTLHILPETGHSHFLFPARAQLFERLAEWAHSKFDSVTES